MRKKSWKVRKIIKLFLCIILCIVFGGADITANASPNIKPGLYPELLLHSRFNPDPEGTVTITKDERLAYIPGTTTSSYIFYVNGHLAFCFQHPINNGPATGTVLTPQIYDDPDIKKTLYYGYNGIEPYTFGYDDEGIVLTSLALAYFYMGDFNFAPTWEGGAYGNYAQSIGFTAFLDFIKSKPAVDDTVDMSLSNDNVTSFTENGYQRTENITFNYLSDQYITMPLPDGVSLVNVTRSTESTGNVQIYGMDTFYLKAPISYKANWSSGDMIGSRGRFAPIVCVTGDNLQDVGYYEWIEDSAQIVQLSVSWNAVGKVTINKVDESGNGLPGAKLQLLDGEKVIDTWTSDGSPHVVNTLEIGRGYTLKEQQAPDGYIKTEEKKFVAAEENNITMTNIPTKIRIQKIDAAGQPLAGATLQVFDAGGNKIDEWVSSTEAHDITGKLTVGKTYILSEALAPDGFIQSHPVEFTVQATEEFKT